MDLPIASLRRFLYSSYFFGGVRQGVGMLLPVMVLAFFFDNYTLGLVATFGANCCAIIDQPGGPQRHRTNEMLGGAVLATLTVIITGFSSTYPVLLWAVVIAQCFVYSLFTVYGKRGGLIGFAGLLLMALTMHSPMPPQLVLVHAAGTLAGGLFYILFSNAFSYIFWLREEQQSMSLALYATADYVAARAAFYDESTDLEDDYRALIQRQSAMTEKHQAARDVVLRSLPRGRGIGDQRRIMIWNLFVDMLQLMDTLFATHTDFVVLRRALKNNDILIFMRDALSKMSMDLGQIALCVARGRPLQRRASVKAELRAIEYEIEVLRKGGRDSCDPEVVAIVIQILRRLRNASRIVDRLADHTQQRGDAVPTRQLRIDKSLTRFLSRQEFRLGMITSNLNMDSPHFRYALRVTLAAAIGMTLSALWLPETFSAHNYWIILTIVIVMKPGFALTRQRNGWRLGGTLLGCVIATVLMALVDRPDILFGALLVACIMGNSLVQLNYMGSAVFNTIFVVLVFHFIAPGTVSLSVVGERALDTLVGCAISLVCSYVFPWWEARYMPGLARAAIKANRDYLRAGLQYADVMQHAQLARQSAEVPPSPEADEADVNWRLARRNVHVAFSNFAEAFYRMMAEPQSHQQYVPELNNLLIQNHILASQTTGAIFTLASLQAPPPPAVQQTLQAVDDMLDLEKSHVTAAPEQIEQKGELASLAYPLKLMVKAAQMIRQESGALAT
jgi:uncharacterized membrane protein YccC